MASAYPDLKDVDTNAVASVVDEETVGYVGTQHNATVKAKYHGTDSDRHEMEMLGKQQVLRVHLLNHYPVAMLSDDSATSRS